MTDGAIVCEWCERRFYLGNRTLDALRATIHAYFSHREELRENYGGEGW